MFISNKVLTPSNSLSKKYQNLKNTQLASLLLGALGGGDTNNVREITSLEEMAELGDYKGGGGAGAEAEDHAGLHVLHSLVCSQFLEVILGENWCRKGFYGVGSVGAGGGA